MKECIILAGGFGTRLQSVVKDVPKCMAEVGEKPFLEYLFQYCSNHNFDHIILALGYKAEIIISWINENNFPFRVSYVIENEPLGTGGAIKYAFEKVVGDSAFVINGDTFFEIDADKLMAFHQLKSADISIALKPMNDFDRYGSVELDSDMRTIRFNEKQYCAQGLINGGVYLINKNLFAKLALPQKFSFEKDVMESELTNVRLYGYEENSYFIDIGIPTDFQKANVDFKNKNAAK